MWVNEKFSDLVEYLEITMYNIIMKIWRKEERVEDIQLTVTEQKIADNCVLQAERAGELSRDCHLL